MRVSALLLFLLVTGCIGEDREGVDDLYASKRCGNGTCNSGESCSSCPNDCGSCTGSMQETLISAGATWRYLDNGTNQGTGWTATTFDDSTWNQGAAELGYGDGDEATTVSFGPSSSSKYITTYFRRAFDLTDASVYSSLKLRLVRDDGAVVYLNGIEVARSNMPTEAGYTTLAASTSTCENCWSEATPLVSALRTGRNVIAVEVHQGDAASSDISFNFELVATRGSSTASCGDGTCDGTETCSSCAADCGACAPACGDGICNGTETCSTCSTDCGPCAGVCADVPPPPRTGGTTRYVSPSGSDSSPGTESQPYATIQKAASVVNPGDIVIVEDGTYTQSAGSPIVTISRGGTATNWVWFKARHRHGAKLDGRNNTNAQGIALTSGVGYVRVEGFEVFGVGTDGSSTGIVAYTGGHDSQIIGNNIHDVGRLCTSTSNGLSGIFIQQPNVLVEQNIIHDTGRFSAGENGCSPSNEYYKNHDHGIYVNGNSPGASGVVIRSNVFYNIKHGWGVQLYPGSMSNVSVVNNTFAFANPYRDGHIVLGASLANSQIVNNIFYQPTGSAISLSGTFTLSNVRVANNLTTASVMLNGSTPSGMTLSTNMLNADPRFVSPTNRDFHLQSTSPAIDAGATLTIVPHDFDGCSRPRGSGYDVGAFEAP